MLLLVLLIILKSSWDTGRSMEDECLVNSERVNAHFIPVLETPTCSPQNVIRLQEVFSYYQVLQL